MNVEDVDILDASQYNRVLVRRRTDLFHSPNWARVLCDAYGLRIRAAIDDDDCAVLYCPVSNELGDRIVSLPFSDYCDPLVDDPAQGLALIKELEAKGLPLTVRCLRCDLSGKVVKKARWHGIQLTDSRDKLWGRLSESKRRAIRKAQRHGVEVARLDDVAFLDTFHRMHVAMRKGKYRLLAQPKRFFESICRHFKADEGWHPLAAMHDGEVIAAMIFLRWQDTLYYKFGTSMPAALPMRPNDLLMWHAMQYACDLGCTMLDLGLSDDDQPGLIRFKRQFGARESEIRNVQFGGDGDPRGVAWRPVLGEITRLMTEPSVPDDVTADAGDLLYDLFA